MRRSLFPLLSLAKLPLRHLELIVVPSTPDAMKEVRQMKDERRLIGSSL
jgi:hypothetical protein